MLVKRRIANRLWLSTPAPNFTQGVASTYDLLPHLRDGASGLVASLADGSNPLQAGVTLDAINKRLVYDGIGVASVANGVRLALGDGASAADLEFALTSALPGVFYVNNFDFATRAQMIASAAAVRFAYVGAGSGHDPTDPPPAAEKLGLDTTVKLTGRASLRSRYRVGLENWTQSSPSYAGSFDGLGVDEEGAPRDKFFKRWIVRYNSKALSMVHNQAGATTTKLMVIFGAFTGFTSGQQGLMCDHLDQRFPMAWLVHSSFDRFKNVWSTNPPGNLDHTYHPFVDLGPQSSGGLNDGNDLALFQRRRGPVRREAGNWSAIFDVANYPVQFRADEWFVIQAMIDKTNDVVKYWFAPMWQPAILFTGCLNAGISASAEYTGFQTMFRPTDGTNVAFTGTDIEWWIDQILISTNPMPMPGGFALPYVNTFDAPAGYPFAGSSEDP